MASVNTIKIKDVVWALNILSKVVQFSEDVGKLVRALNKQMIDIRSLNPSNFEDILKIAMNLYEEGEIDLDVDLENLKELYDEIMEWDINTINRAISIFNTYVSTIDQLKNTIKSASQRLYVTKEEIQFVRNMLPSRAIVREEGGQVTISNLTAEDLAKIRDMIKAMKE